MNGYAPMELFSVSGMCLAYFLLLAYYPLVTLTIVLLTLGLQVVLCLLQSKTLNKFYLYTVNIILAPAIVVLGLYALRAMCSVLHNIVTFNWSQIVSGLSLVGEYGFPFVALLTVPVLSRYIYRHYENKAT